MNHSTPGLPVHHQLPEFTQTHVHQVSDAIQPSHALSSPSLPAPNPSQLALTRRTLVSKVMSLLLNMLSRLVSYKFLIIILHGFSYHSHFYGPICAKKSAVCLTKEEFIHILLFSH